MLGEQVPGVSQRKRGRVVAGKKDNHDFIAHFIIGETCPGLPVPRCNKAIEQVMRRATLDCSARLDQLLHGSSIVKKFAWMRAILRFMRGGPMIGTMSSRLKSIASPIRRRELSTSSPRISPSAENIVFEITRSVRFVISSAMSTGARPLRCDQAFVKLSAAATIAGA